MLLRIAGIVHLLVYLRPCRPYEITVDKALEETFVTAILYGLGEVEEALSIKQLRVLFEP